MDPNYWEAGLFRQGWFPFRWFKEKSFTWTFVFVFFSITRISRSPPTVGHNVFWSRPYPVAISQGSAEDGMGFEWPGSEYRIRDYRHSARDGACCQLILTYQFVFIWLFLTTYWLRNSGKGTTGKCTAATGLAAQWPYYIIVMIMLIPRQLIPTPLCPATRMTDSPTSLLRPLPLPLLGPSSKGCVLCAVCYSPFLICLCPMPFICCGFIFPTHAFVALCLSGWLCCWQFLKIICKRILENKLIEPTERVCPASVPQINRHRYRLRYTCVCVSALLIY